MKVGMRIMVKVKVMEATPAMIMVEGDGGSFEKESSVNANAETEKESSVIANSADGNDEEMVVEESGGGAHGIAEEKLQGKRRGC